MVVGDGMVGEYDYIDQKKSLGYQYDSFSFFLGAVVMYFELRSESFQKVILQLLPCSNDVWFFVDNAVFFLSCSIFLSWIS